MKLTSLLAITFILSCLIHEINSQEVLVTNGDGTCVVKFDGFSNKVLYYLKEGVAFTTYHDLKTSFDSSTGNVEVWPSDSNDGKMMLRGEFSFPKAQKLAEQSRGGSYLHRNPNTKNVEYYSGKLKSTTEVEKIWVERFDSYGFFVMKG
jgi:hypothetical protein